MGVAVGATAIAIVALTAALAGSSSDGGQLALAAGRANLPVAAGEQAYASERNSDDDHGFGFSSRFDSLETNDDTPQPAAPVAQTNPPTSAVAKAVAASSAPSTSPATTTVTSTTRNPTGPSTTGSSTTTPAITGPSTTTPATTAPSTTTPATTATSALALPGYEQRGANALSLVSYPWQRQLPGWVIEFKPERKGYYGLTMVDENRIEVYVRSDQSDALLAHVVAHEIGHALDVTLNDGDDRRRWQEARGISDAPWWPSPAATDFSTGAGDFAESFAHWQVGGTSFRSNLGPTPNDAQRALLAELGQG